MNHSTVTKSLIALGLTTIILFSGCSNSSEISNKTANKNTNQTNTPEAAPTSISPENLATKTKIEDALKKAGFTNITVDAATTPIALRGTVPGDKVAEVIFIAEQAAGKPLKNEITEKK